MSTRRLRSQGLEPPISRGSSSIPTETTGGGALRSSARLRARAARQISQVSQVSRPRSSTRRGRRGQGGRPGPRTVPTYQYVPRPEPVTVPVTVSQDVVPSHSHEETPASSQVQLSPPAPALVLAPSSLHFSRNFQFVPRPAPVTEPQDEVQLSSPTRLERTVDLTDSPPLERTIDLTDFPTPTIAVAAFDLSPQIWRYIPSPLAATSSTITSSSTSSSRTSISSTSSSQAMLASNPPSVALQCPVCLDNFSAIRSRGRDLVSTTCGHVFCRQCLQQCLLTSRNCPTCRRRITHQDYHPLFL